MSFFEIILIAISLSVDATVCAMVYAKNKFNNISTFKLCLVLSLLFGIFQGIMPLIGYMLGINILKYIESFDHWLASGLLFLISANMLKEAFFTEDKELSCPISFSYKTIFILAIATSIDALAIGISLAILDNNIYISSLIIALICFIMSYIASFIAQKISNLKINKKLLDSIGALMLIYIAIKVLIEHKAFSFLG